MAPRARTTKKKTFWGIVEQLDTSPLGLLKIVGLVFVGIILFAFVAQLLGTSVRSLNSVAKRGIDGLAVSTAPSAAYDYAYHDDVAYEEAYAYGESAGGYGGGANLSIRNAVGTPIVPPSPGTTVGDDAEAFEVTEYNASIETHDKANTCTTIADLKVFDYVIFEQANEYERGCNYTFKVRQERVADVLAVIEQLNPEELSENTYTIKNRVDDFTSETDILQKKLVAIDETLENALAAYDEITELATQSRDAGSLATIIDSKVQLIERLTQERINISERLDRIERAKTEQLDRLVYTYFHVNVYERKYVDGEQLKDSWKEALRTFVYDINRVVQDVTVNLVVLLFTLVQYVLYVLILVVVVKYVWRWIRYIWKQM